MSSIPVLSHELLRKEGDRAALYARLPETAPIGLWLDARERLLQRFEFMTAPDMPPPDPSAVLALVVRLLEVSERARGALAVALPGDARPKIGDGA